jgi:predicted solute-binding protein
LAHYPAKVTVSAVSYLNPVPLIWGMLHGKQREQVDLRFSIPSVCAREVEQGHVQIGLVPVAEVARQQLEVVPGVGITCRGAVRSILLVSRRPFANIQKLAVDLSSRTSVQLARVILRERFGVEPELAPAQPDLEQMLAHSEAALIIGDPALRLTPDELPYECLDLGAEWFTLTGLPMVFAAWAGKPGLPLDLLTDITRGSYEFGKASIDEIVNAEYARRGVTQALAARYLRHYIRYELGIEELRGLQAFYELARLNQPALTNAI